MTETAAPHVARVAVFDAGIALQPDDEDRAASLRALVRGLPGFVAGYHLRDDAGRIMSLTIGESDEALEDGEAAVARRPVEDQRGIRPTRVERWIVDGAF